jgi:membrane dipeptidase
MEMYQQWKRDGKVGAWTEDLRAAATGRPAVGILMEGADPIQSPDELGWWVEGGLVAIGLSWVSHSRYAGGNDEARGLTAAGRELVTAIDEAGLVHDVSHLSDRSFDELCMHSDGRIMASHSNCRALLHDGRPDRQGVPAFQRHLSDAQTREIARRGGVIGINLYSAFLDSTTTSERPSADLSRIADHIQHICDVTGSAGHVGLGSDMDGGFSAAQLPRGIRTHADLHQIADELASRGWSPADIERFAWGNWARFWTG